MIPARVPGRRCHALPLALILLVTACGPVRRAPVIERGTGAQPPAAAQARPAARAEQAAPERYTIKRGDTLYGIALDHGLDYREIAAWNAIENPSLIREGQTLRLTAPEADATTGASSAPPASQSAAQSSPSPATAPQGVVVNPVTSMGTVESRPLQAGAKPAASAPAIAGGAGLKTEPKAIKLPYSDANLALLSNATAPAKPGAETGPATQPAAPASPQVASASPSAGAATAPGAAPAPSSSSDEIDWIWPARGRVLAGFSDPANKGLDISGKTGEPVLASASGKVVYSGEGLRGYGKLIIIKHNNTYLSAYAHNENILVKEGETVVKGQKIGEIGDTGTDQTKLHFEIRRLGKPVDPAKLLPQRPS